MKMAFPIPFFLTLLLFCPIGAWGQDPGPDSEECQDFISSLPSTFSYGWLTLPEEPGNLSGHKIKVFYYHPRNLQGQIAVFLNGGPGSDSHSSYSVMQKTLEKHGLENAISFVYIDQRGNGCSSYYPNGIDQVDTMNRAKWYGSRGIVEDAEAIRKHLLGNQTWNVFGQSYGAYISHQYQVLYPTSIRKNIAHGFAIRHVVADRMPERALAQINMWNEFFTLHPEMKPKMDFLLKNLTMDMCLDDGKVCGVYVLKSFTGMLGFRDRWPKLKDWIAAIVPKDNEIAWSKITELNINRYEELPDDEPIRSIGLATVMVFDRGFDQISFDARGCNYIKGRLDKTHPGHNMTGYFTECSAPFQNQYVWKDLEIAANHFKSNDLVTIQKFKESLQVPGAGKFYLYAGAKDIFSAPDSFIEEVRETQGLLVYRLFQNSGHEGFHSEKQVLEDLLSN